jgi:surface polysaccharide O-acyltransferase-like enzyme
MLNFVSTAVFILIGITHGVKCFFPCNIYPLLRDHHWYNCICYLSYVALIISILGFEFINAERYPRLAVVSARSLNRN